jgi:hypothetical protein
VGVVLWGEVFLLLLGGGYCSEGNTKIVNTKGVHKFIGLAPIKYMVSELAMVGCIFLPPPIKPLIII